MCWNTLAGLPLLTLDYSVRTQVQQLAQGQEQHTARLTCRHHLKIHEKCEWSLTFIEALIRYSSVHTHKTLKQLGTHCMSWEHFYGWGSISYTRQWEHISKNKGQFHFSITYHSGKHKHLSNDWLYTYSRQKVISLHTSWKWKIFPSGMVLSYKGKSLKSREMT